MARFNFSVRNGKRWSPCAVITLIRSEETHDGSCKDISETQVGQAGRLPRLITVSFIFSHVPAFFTGTFVLSFCAHQRPGTYRAISTARLNMSPCLHLRPINVVVCDGPWRDLILEPASCLDAFSTYPAQTPLPGCAPARDNRCTGGLSGTVLSY